MSLRPAQELVQESSKFSLRHFFEAQAPIRSPAELPTEGFPTLNAQPDLAPQSPPASAVAPPFPRPHASLIGAPPPKEGKFTFTGLMPAATTPIQLQHKILQQHQQQAISQAAANAKPTGTQADSGNEVLRLKAHVLSLNERLAQANASLTATSESVIRGNKALTTERAQFHAKYASITKKLEATQAALAEVEALPKEDVNNSKLLNAKVLELQLENEKLVATRDALEEQLSEKAAAAVEVEVEAATPIAIQAEEELRDLRAKFTSLAAQHSSLIDKHALLEHEIEAKEGLIEAIEAEATAANERAVGWEAQVDELKDQLEASRVEIAQTDDLVDTLDEKLAAARLATEEAPAAEDDASWTIAEREAEAVTVEAEATDSCCPATARCEEMERAAREAFSKTNGASEHECARLHEEWKFLDGLARRARHALTTGEPERVMVAHVYTGALPSEAPFELASHVGTNPLVMGKTIDENCLHCQANTIATDAEAPRDTSCAAARTNAFVQAVSKDLKFSMDGSQALYASSASTGVALRV